MLGKLFRKTWKLTSSDFQGNALAKSVFFTMTTLPLSPLPCMRDDAAERGKMPLEDGFVDDSVVLALAAGAGRRSLEDRVSWILRADDTDFAGWGCVPTVLTPKAAPDVRRAAAPELAELGIGEPHHGRHRWWLAGIAGAVTALLASALLLTLAARQKVEERELTIIRPAPAAPLPAAKPEAPRAAPELTGLAGDE